jgi:hypothetical protein
MQWVAPPSLPGVKYHGATKPDLEISLGTSVFQFATNPDFGLLTESD